jgi:hypothetical protein
LSAIGRTMGQRAIKRKREANGKARPITSTSHGRNIQTKTCGAEISHRNTVATREEQTGGYSTVQYIHTVGPMSAYENITFRACDGRATESDSRCWWDSLQVGRCVTALPLSFSFPNDRLSAFRSELVADFNLIILPSAYGGSCRNLSISSCRRTNMRSLGSCSNHTCTVFT